MRYERRSAMDYKRAHQKSNEIHTRFVCLLIPRRVAGNILWLLLLLLTLPLKHVLEELELCLGHGRQAHKDCDDV